MNYTSSLRLFAHLYPILLFKYELFRRKKNNFKKKKKKNEIKEKEENLPNEN